MTTMCKVPVYTERPWSGTSRARPKVVKMRRQLGFLLSVLFLVPVTAGAESGFLTEMISPPDISCWTTSVAATAITAQRNDDLHAIWVEEGPTGTDVYYYKYNNASRKWSSGLALSEGGHAKDAAISVDYQGNIHCVWEDQGRIYHRMRNATSEEWHEAFLVSEDGYGPMVLCDRAPNAHILWIQKAVAAGNAYLAHRYVDAYGKWSATNPVSPENAFSTEPAVALDDRNGLHAVWKMTFNASKPYDLCYAYRRAGSSWDPFTRILDGASREFSRPAIAADKDFYLHLVWAEGSEGMQRIYYIVWKGRWGDPVPLTDSPSSARNPAVATDEGQNVHVVWEDTRDHPESGTAEIYYRRLWPLGVWTLPQRLTIGHALQGVPPSVKVSTTSRDLHIIWSEEREGKGTVLHGVWLGQRKEDVTRAGSKARSALAEIQREPFISPQARKASDLASAAYQEALDSLERFDVSTANQKFLECLELLEEGQALDDRYKEVRGRRMGITLALVGAIPGGAILASWLALRRREG